MDFHQLIEAIDINRLIIIDYIDCLSMIDSQRLGKLGYYSILRFDLFQWFHVKGCLSHVIIFRYYIITKEK